MKKWAFTHFLHTMEWHEKFLNYEQKKAINKTPFRNKKLLCIANAPTIISNRAKHKIHAPNNPRQITMNYYKLEQITTNYNKIQQVPVTCRFWTGCISSNPDK